MSNPLYALPAACEQTLRALARYPERTAFSWPGGSMTYRGATDMIGRIQSVFMQMGFAPGTRVTFLTANRADTWCAGCAGGSGSTSTRTGCGTPPRRGCCATASASRWWHDCSATRRLPPPARSTGT